jgi:DNA polymerase-1
VIALATAYGRTAFQQSGALGITTEESQRLIDKYFERYPKVELMMLESHEQAKKQGAVYNLFGRPRRMPEAMEIPTLYGNALHAELPYLARNLLNLAMNHRIQSTGASIVNRAAIKLCHELSGIGAKLVMQVHDSLIVECEEKYAKQVAERMQDCMENTVLLPGVKLEAEPKIGYNLSEV